MLTVRVSLAGVSVPARTLTVLGGDSRRERSPAGPSVRFDNLVALAEQASRVWPELDTGGSLLTRVIREAEQSDLINGTSPESWSPLAPFRSADTGQFRSAADVAQSVSETVGPDINAAAGDLAELRVRTSDFETPLATLLVDRSPLGAVWFAADAYVVPLQVDVGTELIVSYEPDDDVQREEEEAAGRYLASEVPDGHPTNLLLWRCYFGTNTDVVDGITEFSRRQLRRIRFAGMSGSGWLVGRVLFATHKIVGRPTTDVTMPHRLHRATLALPQVAEQTPSITSPSAGDVLEQHHAVVGSRRAAVAIHGTMACALPLAAELQALVGDTPLLRFEHDTWLPISTNARQLEEAVYRLNLDEVVLVAHSRGGLVAREAAAGLRQDPRIRFRVVTLGSPFRGTPLISATRVGLLGFHALMGMIRTLGGGFAMDAVTRLAGLLIKSELPQGLAEMDPNAGYLRVWDFVDFLPISSFGGDFVPGGPNDSHQFAFLEGLSGPAFGAAANDLVVPMDSAFAGTVPASAVTVGTTHFDYMRDQTVQSLIRSIFG